MANRKLEDEIEKKLEYLGLNLKKVPETLKMFEPLNFKPQRNYEEKGYKQYRYVSIKDIEIMLTPATRLDDLEEKYNKAAPVYEYLISNREENLPKYATFLNMLDKVKIEDIEKIEEEQVELNKKIPFKVKYSRNYLWQIYYAELSNKYFMLVPTEDSDYSAFFYLLKKQIEKKKTGKIFVPINYVDYSREILKRSEIEDIANYLWLFTKNWANIYDVYDKNDELTIYIVGETQVFENIKTTYRVKLKDKTEATKFYKLLKALFILQTELPHYFKFATNIDKQGELEFYFENKKIEYEFLVDFINEQYRKLLSLEKTAETRYDELQEKLNKMQILAAELNIEYVAKEKQISTFLECKKTFFGKVKYFIKYSKKKKNQEEKEENIDILEEDDEETEIDKKIGANKYGTSKNTKSNYTLEELIEKYRKYAELEVKIRNIAMDVNAIKLKNKNLTKKIENATKFIEEIDKHRRSIFEFWKYSNKDEVAVLPEGEKEEVNIQKISKIFNYEEDLEDFGERMDRKQRKNLTKEELDSIFITTTDVIGELNKIKNGVATPKDMADSLKLLKEKAKEKRKMLGEEEFDVFGGITDSRTRVKSIANKSHREVPKNEFSIMDINSNTNQLGYKMTLQKIVANLDKAIDKITIEEDMAIYKAIEEENLVSSDINLFNLNPQKEFEKIINSKESKIYLYKIHLNRGNNLIAYTNSVFYENKNKTLPIGMDLSTNVLVDLSKLELAQDNNEKSFRIACFDNENDDFSKIQIKSVEVLEYFEKSLEEE